ncbi:hypothetical protein R5W23_003672 [Gemmata sp. JC673]|uniref:WD40 repeat domain-containing protein n=1 Tax=Gemmata algarum TaxID=2975278 RepID=A0ABU5F3S2_9BACT|nr:hypothetical protein [Gemmata algarum]MDY3562210.1 hypothetical protein [Gemmata algarum]
MRELRLKVPKRADLSTVRRLQFVAGGADLVIWVGEGGTGGGTMTLHVHTLSTGTTRELNNDILWESMEPVVSPDGWFLAAENVYHSSHIYVEDLTRRSEDGFHLPAVTGPEFGLSEIVFTPDGSELLAVRHLSQQGRVTHTRDLARFPLGPYREPPLGYEQKINPLTELPFQMPIYDVGWRDEIPLPPGRYVHSAAISADGRLFAAGDAGGGVLVVELARGEVLASFRRTWPALAEESERVVRRVAFVPGGEWVVSRAGGRLFADPLGAAKPWKTGSELAHVNDFAVHPSGRLICAVCADGRTRYLDPATGTVTQTFKWAKGVQQLCSVCFAPDGLTCAAGGTAGRVVLWDVDA